MKAREQYLTDARYHLAVDTIARVAVDAVRRVNIEPRRWEGDAQLTTAQIRAVTEALLAMSDRSAALRDALTDV